MHIQEIMNPRVRTVSKTMPAERAREEMKGLGIRHLVVLDDGRPAGILSERDLRAIPSGKAAGSLTTGDLMSTRIVSVKPETTVRQAANILRGHLIGCLPVMDRGRLVGMVTISDLLELVGRGSTRLVARSEHPEIRALRRNKRAVRFSQS